MTLAPGYSVQVVVTINPPSTPGTYAYRVGVALALETGLESGDTLAQFLSRFDTGSLGVKLRTRGIFRLKQCGFPPIRLDLPSKNVDNTPFAGEDRLKLVTHCQGDRLFERNLLREYALYRVFNAVTDTSFRVRLAHMTYVDSARHDTVTRYGFLIESDTALALRIHADQVRSDNVYDPVTDPSYMTLVAVFQYLIGNNDWSVWKRHNIAIFQEVAQPRPLLAVPYDFDFSGAVNAPYASPPEQLKIHPASVHGRGPRYLKGPVLPN